MDSLDIEGDGQHLIVTETSQVTVEYSESSSWADLVGVIGGRHDSSESFCAGAYEDWMSSLPPALWDVPLHHLSIPGSLGSMTFRPDKKSALSPSAPRLLRVLHRVAPCVTRAAAGAWAVTQGLDVTEQLASGVRYLDLRVAHEPGAPARTLRFVHTVYSRALVEDALTDIAEWLHSHPREALILHCRGFEGVTPDLHDYLLCCIRNILGDVLCPSGDVPTLRELWASGRQVLLCYEEAAAASRRPELWPGVPCWRGDAATPRALVRYLDAMKGRGRPGGLFVASTGLTPSLRHALTRPGASLRRLTEAGRPQLAAWVRAQRPGPAPCATNIIAADFVGGGGRDTLVGEVIALNWKLLRDG